MRMEIRDKIFGFCECFLLILRKTIFSMGDLFTMVTARADYEQGVLIILDQTQLPNREEYLALRTPEEIWEAIYLLKVRGLRRLAWRLLTGFRCVCRVWKRPNLMVSIGSFPG